MLGHTRTQTHKVTDATDQPTHVSATAGVANALYRLKSC